MAVNTFEMTCQRMGVMVVILVVFPLIVAGSMIAVLVAAGNDLPDWALLLVIFLILLLTAYWLIGFIKKWGTAPCTVDISEQEIRIKLKNRSIFFPGTEFSSSWDKLRSASSGYEPQRQERFYKVEFTNPELTLYLNSPQKLNDSNEETEFGSFFNAYVALQNADSEKQGKQQIDTKNFYQSGWAKGITYTMWIALASLITAKFLFPDDVDVWRMTQFTIMSGIWLTAYYINNRKRK